LKKPKFQKRKNRHSMRPDSNLRLVRTREVEVEECGTELTMSWSTSRCMIQPNNIHMLFLFFQTSYIQIFFSQKVRVSIEIPGALISSSARSTLCKRKLLAFWDFVIFLWYFVMSILIADHVLIKLNGSEVECKWQSLNPKSYIWINRKRNRQL